MRTKTCCSALALMVGLMSSGLHAQVTDADREIQRATMAAKEPVIPRFAIKDYRIEGNTLLPPELLQSAVAPFTGEQKDFGDVQGAIEALEAIYKQRGFTTISVLLPEQVLESGQVQIRIVEGKVRQINVTDNQYFDRENILSSLPSLRVGSVPIIGDISAALRVANENPAKKVVLKVSPADDSDDIDANIKVTDQKPLSFGLSLDNTGSEQTGMERLGITAQYSNLFNRDHILTFQYQTSPFKLNDVNVYALAYRLPLYQWGDVIDFYASKSSVNAGFIAAGPFNLAITGKGQSYGAKYTFKLKRFGEYDHELVAGIDSKLFENSIAAGSLELGNNLQVYPVSVSYTGHWAQEGRDLSGNISLAHNLPGGAEGGQASFDKARTGSNARYSVLRAGLTYSHALAADWQARAVVTAQYANEPLIPGEQFGVGGATSVRGFDERVVSNDKGVQGNLELYTPELCAKRWDGHQCRALAYYDWGSVYRVEALSGEQASEHVASAGIGMRWAVSNVIAFQLDYATVLQGDGNQQAGDWKAHVRLGVTF